MRQHRSRTSVSLLSAALVALAIAGCGVGAGPGTKDASIEVTSDFGAHTVGSATEAKVPGAETVMSMLERHFKVSTKYGGGYVQSIDGHAGSSNHLDWFYYVNGILAPEGAAATDIHKGDHIWWDLHDWAATQTIPAVVGSYPEPFTNGSGGQEYPTLLECATNFQSACDKVGASLKDAGVKAGPQVLGTGSGSDSLAVVVGTWSELKGIVAAELIAGGPANSGVYAQFVGKRGQEVELDNPLGDVAKSLGGSVGMIAATDEVSLGEPVWFVTGTDAAAVNNAAKHFNTATLRNHFAVVLQGNHVIPVPLTS